MKLLLDTHAFLWALWEPARLSNLARSAFLDSGNELIVSAASYWEICIKQTLGKLELVDGWEVIFDREMAINGIQWLGIEKEHCRGIQHLPKTHGDPFDRLLVAQAIHEGLTIMTSDTSVAGYTVDTLW